jgi:hypothetical protein
MVLHNFIDVFQLIELSSSAANCVIVIWRTYTATLEFIVLYHTSLGDTMEYIYILGLWEAIIKICYV